MKLSTISNVRLFTRPSVQQNMRQLMSKSAALPMKPPMSKLAKPPMKINVRQRKLVIYVYL